MKLQILILFLAIAFMGGGAASAVESGSEMDQIRQELKETREEFKKMRSFYEEKIDKMQDRIGKLEDKVGKKSVGLPPKVPIPNPPGLTPPGQPIRSVFPASAGYGVGRYFQNFNPDISVIGDFLYHWTDQKQDELYHQFQFRELELAFSAHVDTFARADVFFTVGRHHGEWHTGLEEGYITLLSLPFDLQAKLGQFRPDFGKANRYHFHNMPWVDYPNIITNYFGEEGMSEPGVGLTWLVPNPWDIYSELMFEMFNNNNELSFAGHHGRGLVYLTHLKNSIDINEESTIEAGGSFAVSASDDGHGHNKTVMEGADLTYKWRPLKRGHYKSIVFQNELFACQKMLVENDGRIRHDTWGLYSSLIYQFQKRWSIFSRYDFSEFPNISGDNEHGISGGITFAQSEYCFWRLQYKHTERSYDKNEDEIWVQLDFGLGPHRKHEY